MEPGISPGARASKESVNYRQHPECGQCDHYYSTGNCDLVEGNISPDNVCDRWEIKSQRSPYKDKEFFMSEYKKVSNGS